MTDALLRAVQLAPRRTAAVAADGTRRTWREVHARVVRLAGALTALGTRPGDRVVLAMANRPEYLECYFACAWARLVAVPLNTRLSPDERRRYLDLVDPVLVVTDQDGEGDGGGPGTSARPVTVRRHGRGGPAPRAYADLLAGPPAERPVAGREDDPAALFGTGGTTGTPKAVVLTHRNIVTGSQHVQMALSYRPSDLYLHAAPMFHIADFASLLAVTQAGGGHAFTAPYRPHDFARRVERDGVTATLMVPTMVRALLDDPSATARDLSSWRLLFYGGAPMPPDLLREALTALPCRLAQGYGMTEISLGAVLSERDHDHYAGRGGPLPARRLRGIGRAAPGVGLRINRPDHDGVGELQVSGPNVCAGYWRDEDATRRAFTEDGWCRTGDLARMDEEGYVELVDRLKDVVITGGENVYSLEVERVLSRHEAVAQVAVVGLPDVQWGERVHAVVVLRQDADPAGTPADLDRLANGITAFARRTLAAYKVPRTVEFVEALPVTGPGKVDKKRLRKSRTPAHAESHTE
ncbi:AMP-binding protein [Streptomyces sp. NPDC005805]|uniref:AMP-binding protein n=1 Tax=Streptomyces sp. NPDC005805 TaxID=3157068 RepID=UPI0033FF7A34